MADYHVTRRSPGEWAVIRENSQRVSSYENTQREAELTAKELASNSGGGEVRIHGLNGKIRDSDTVYPANDPFPPRDRYH